MGTSDPPLSKYSQCLSLKRGAWSLGLLRANSRVLLQLILALAHTLVHVLVLAFTVAVVLAKLYAVRDPLDWTGRDTP